MRITKDHFGKKMVLPGWAGTGRYFIPSAITEVNNRVVGTTYIPGQESYTSWQSNDDHWADHNHWEYYTAEPASQESEAAGVGKPGYLTMDHIGKRVRRDKDGNALTLLGINLTGPHFSGFISTKSEGRILAGMLAKPADRSIFPLGIFTGLR